MIEERKIKLALAQINPITGDIVGNTTKIIKEIEDAKKNNADLIIFPEMAITGYCLSDIIEDKEFIRANKKALEAIASRTDGIGVIVGFVDFEENKKNEDGSIKKYNAAAVLQNGQIAGISHKTLLPNYRYFDDKRYFSEGEKRKAIPIKTAKGKINLGVSICEDMWDKNYPVKPISELVNDGADLIININASPFAPGKFEKRYSLIKKHVEEHGKPFVYLNTVGAADNGKNIIPFDGQSIVCDADGEIVKLGEKFKEETFYAELDLEKEVENPVILPKTEKEEEIFNALVMSLRDYARKSGFKRAIVPVSGGIDSALGLVLCAEAFGKENVIAYNLPSKFNTETTKSLAEKLAKNLDIQYRVIPIQEIDDTIKGVFEKNNHQIQRKVTKENIHARIRGLLMMLESNDSGALLVSNGNKTEIALGYSTLYGDMCGGLSVIGDLSKVEVYKLAEYVNKKAGREKIPGDIIYKLKPSAELSEGQYDPFDYFVTSPIVDEFIEERKNPEAIIRMFKDKTLNRERFVKDWQGKTVYDKHTNESFIKLVYETYNLLRKSVYKRVQGPPIIVVTKRAFGYDYREPLINYWGGNIK